MKVEVGPGLGLEGLLLGQPERKSAKVNPENPRERIEPVKRERLNDFLERDLMGNLRGKNGEWKGRSMTNGFYSNSSFPRKVKRAIVRKSVFLPVGVFNGPKTP